MGDSGIPHVQRCQRRYKVQDETSTQLHLLEAFSIKKDILELYDEIKRLNKYDKIEDVELNKENKEISNKI